MLTLADIARLAGVTPRSVQLWTEAGALKPLNDTHGGRGKHRLFDPTEAHIAMALNVFASRGAPIGTLKTISEAIRPYSRKRLAAWWAKCSREIGEELSAPPR